MYVFLQLPFRVSGTDQYPPVCELSNMVLSTQREKGIKVTPVYNCVTQILKIIKLVVTQKHKCACLW